MSSRALSPLASGYLRMTSERVEALLAQARALRDEALALVCQAEGLDPSSVEGIRQGAAGLELVLREESSDPESLESFASVSPQKPNKTPGD